MGQRIEDKGGHFIEQCSFELVIEEPLVVHAINLNFLLLDDL
jgi:hypothetical protein